MKKLMIILLLLAMLPITANAMEFTAPQAPADAEKLMPEDSTSFSEDLWYIIRSAIPYLQPSVAEAGRIGLSLIVITLLISILQNISGASKHIVQLVGTIAIGVALFRPSNALIQVGVQTVKELNEYGKLLLPVMTAAMAAQGAPSTSAALYTGTVLFNTVLISGITKLIVPLLYIFLVISIANNCVGNEMLKNLQASTKGIMTWGLKAFIYIFSGYLTITGVVSGAADASAVKAAKLIISGSVPVVGKIISDASETILVSAGVMRSAAGVYGIVAIVAIFLVPFLKIGVQYLILKLTASVCSIFGAKESVSLIMDFSTIMGFILAIVGTVCLLLLISTVCLMKGIS